MNWSKSLVGGGGGGGGGAKSFSLQTQLFVVRLGCVEVEFGL